MNSEASSGEVRVAVSPAGCIFGSANPQPRPVYAVEPFKKGGACDAVGDTVPCRGCTLGLHQLALLLQFEYPTSTPLHSALDICACVKGTCCRGHCWTSNAAGRETACGACRVPV